MESKLLKCIGNHDDRQQKLSTFRSLDLNDFSIEFYSDDDEEDTSYIEIALDEPLALSMVPQLHNQEGEGEKVTTKSKEKSNTTCEYPDNQELEFQMSSSPLVSTFPGFPTSTLSSSTNTNNTATTRTCTSECSHANADGCAVKSQGSPPKGHSKFSQMPIIGTGNNKRKQQFPAFHQLLHVLLLAFKQLSSSSSLENTKLCGRPDGYIDDDNKTAMSATGSWEVVKSRKTSEPLTTAVNNQGVILKVMIKLKSISIQSLLASVLKPQQAVVSPGGSNTSQQNKRGPNKQRLMKNHRTRLVKPFDKRTPVKPTNQQEDQSNFNRSSNTDKYFLEAIRGILESLSMMKIGRSKGNKMSKSCSNSIKSTPIHGEVLVHREARQIYTRDNSVQAAIAYCKSSFGQMNSP